LELLCAELKFRSKRIDEARVHAEEAERLAKLYQLTGYHAMAWLWKGRLLLADKDPAIEPALVLYKDAITTSVKYGPSLLQAILDSVEEQLPQIHKVTPGLGLQLTENMLLWKEFFMSLKLGNQQAEKLEKWFETLANYLSDWKIKQRAESRLENRPEK
jgi:hypothetical protein